MSSHADSEQENYSKTIFGFWIYLLTDFVMFGALFSTYAVLKNNTFGGPAQKELFHLSTTLIQTLFLLGASFTAGLAGVAAHRRQKNFTLFFFFLTFALGAVFLAMGWNELSALIRSGNDWGRSASLSAFFTLVSTHLLHVAIGLLWTLVFAIPVFFQGLTSVSIRRMTCLRMFWQFVNVVWIFIFSSVYLLGGK